MPRIDTKIEPSPFTPLLLPLVRWLVPRIPAFITPDQLTVSGLALMLLAGVALYLASFDRLWFVVSGVALFGHWFTDNLDGELARARNASSERGFFLDYMLDQLGFQAAFLGVAAATYTHFPLIALFAIVALLRGQLLLHWILLKRTYIMPFPGPAEVPSFIVALSILTALSDPLVVVAGYRLSWFDAAALVLVPFTLIDLILDVARLARRLGSEQ